MPMISIEYDDTKVSKEEIQSLCVAIQKIVSEATNIEDVFVYANSALVKVSVAPVEIFIQMTAEKITDENKLFGDIKSRLLAWKNENSFTIPLNLTLIPMRWKVEVKI